MATPKKTTTKKTPAKKAPVTEPKEVTSTTAGPSQKELLALGKEINTIIFPDEPVDFEEVADAGIEALVDQIKADAENIEPGDDFSDEAKATLEALGVEIEWEAKKADPAKTEKKAKTPAKKADPAKGKKEKGDLAVFLEKEFANKDVEKRTEDDIVLAARKVCPDKPYRVIGNAVYAAARKAGVTLKK